MASPPLPLPAVFADDALRSDSHDFAIATPRQREGIRHGNIRQLVPAIIEHPHYPRNGKRDIDTPRAIPTAILAAAIGPSSFFSLTA